MLANPNDLLHYRSMSLDEAPTYPIEDIDLAWDIAHAYKPFLDIARVARSVGKHGIAADIEFKGEMEALRVEQIGSAEGRMKDWLIERQAFSRLCQESEEDVITLTDFKLSKQAEGIAAWVSLAEIVDENPDELPIRFVEYCEGKHAVVGDAEAASLIIEDPIIAEILHETALYLAMSKGRAISTVSQPRGLV